MSVYSTKLFLQNVKFEFDKFRETHGFVAYDNLMEIFSKLYMKVEELEKSRDIWKDKYRTLKLEDKKGGKNHGKTN